MEKTKKWSWPSAIDADAFETNYFQRKLNDELKKRDELNKGTASTFTYLILTSSLFLFLIKRVSEGTHTFFWVIFFFGVGASTAWLLSLIENSKAWYLQREPNRFSPKEMLIKRDSFIAETEKREDASVHFRAYVNAIETKNAEDIYVHNQKRSDLLYSSRKSLVIGFFLILSAIAFSFGG